VKSNNALIVYKISYQINEKIFFENYQDGLTSCESKKYSQKDLLKYFPIINDKEIKKKQLKLIKIDTEMYNRYIKLQRNFYDIIHDGKTGLYAGWINEDLSLVYIFDVVYCSVGMHNGKCFDYKKEGNTGSFSFIFYDSYEDKYHKEKVKYIINEKTNDLTIYFANHENEKTNAKPVCIDRKKKNQMFIVIYSDDSVASSVYYAYAFF